MYTLLNTINSPADLKMLKQDKLLILADEIREFLLETVSKTGGHLASNLGCVELTLALHYCFNSPEDSIIWDVGHQAYTHKIITGRRDKFITQRQYHGISGFPKRSESMHDAFGAGHSSTSISAGLGMAVAHGLKEEANKVIAVIGDGSLTGGIAFEALNQAGHLRKNLIVVLNDNEMSISKNVGALSTFISRKLTGSYYRGLKKEMQGLLKNIPAIGGNILHFAASSPPGRHRDKRPVIPLDNFNIMDYKTIVESNRCICFQLVLAFNFLDPDVRDFHKVYPPEQISRNSRS